MIQAIEQVAVIQADGRLPEAFRPAFGHKARIVVLLVDETAEAASPETPNATKHLRCKTASFRNGTLSMNVKGLVDTNIWIQNNLEAMSRYCEVSPVALASIRSAHRIRLRYRFSYWDSLIVASALESGCTVLYLEDMQEGQEIEGNLRIDNPLA